jgi:RHS repeat-associated protein
MASRVSTLESIGLTYYDWDGINVIQEKDASNSVADRQLHGYAPIVSVGDIVLIDKGAGGAFVPIADQVGTIWNLIDDSAAVANSYVYDAFGGGRGMVEAIPSLFRFGTKRLAVDLSLYHFIARQYEASLARFISGDPLSSHQQSRQYTYAGSHPTAAVDPVGLRMVYINIVLDPKAKWPSLNPAQVSRLLQQMLAPCTRLLKNDTILVVVAVGGAASNLPPGMENTWDAWWFIHGSPSIWTQFVGSANTLGLGSTAGPNTTLNVSGILNSAGGTWTAQEWTNAWANILAHELWVGMLGGNDLFGNAYNLGDIQFPTAGHQQPSKADKSFCCSLLKKFDIS